MSRRERQECSCRLEAGGHINYADAFRTCSGGQQQRVALARQGTAAAPDAARRSFRPRRSCGRRCGPDPSRSSAGTATVVVTHDPKRPCLADRIVLMHRGRIQQVGALEELYIGLSAPRRFLLGEINRIRGAGWSRGDGARRFFLRRPCRGRGGSGSDPAEAIKLLLESHVIQPGGRMVDAKFLGRSSLVHLSVANGQGLTTCTPAFRDASCPTKALLLLISIQLKPLSSH